MKQAGQFFFGIVGVQPPDLVTVAAGAGLDADVEPTSGFQSLCNRGQMARHVLARGMKQRKIGPDPVVKMFAIHVVE